MAGAANRRFVTLWVVCMSVASAALAQPPGPLEPGTATISGYVLESATGRPIPNASVRVVEVRRHQMQAAAAAADGSYAFAGIIDGEYRVFATSDTHVETCFGAIAGLDRNCTGVILAPGQVHDDVTLHLLRGAIIRGRVLDRNGQPMVRVAVQATGGAAANVVADIAWTDTRGEYELRKIPPGDTMLRTLTPVAVGPNRLRAAQAFYPGVFNLEDAITLAAVAGGVIAGADILLPEVRLSTIRVQPAAPPDLPITNLELKATARSQMSIQTVTLDRDGWGTLANLQSGRYIMTARARSGDARLAAFEAVDVHESTVEIPLYLQPTGRLTGRIVTSRGDPPPIDGARVVAAWTLDGEDVDPLVSDQVEIAPDGQFTIDGLFGWRTLRVIGLPPEWDVRSVMLGQKDVSAGLQVVANTGLDLVITVAHR
jgi:hypothetical protein